MKAQIQSSGVAGKSGGLPGSGLNLGLAVAVATALFMGLALVWVSNVRTDLGYDLIRLKRELDAGEAYQAQLEVERDRLLAPHVLDRRAGELGLRDARPDQIRRMDEPLAPDAAE